MNYKEIDSSVLIESMGYLYASTMGELMWNNYSLYLIPRLEELSSILKNHAENVKELEYGQAASELAMVKNLIPLLDKLQSDIEESDLQNREVFRVTASNFFDSVKLLCQAIEEKAEMHYTYIASKSILAEDWDRPEDDHWDTY